MPAQDIETVLLTRLQAALERWYSGDPYGYADLLAEKFTYFDPFMNERLTDQTQLRAHYAALEGTVKLPRFEIVDPRVSPAQGLAVLTYFLKQYDDAGPWGPTWKTTEVYREVGEDTWKIVHAHWSSCSEEA